ncbi:MAG: pilus assembly protein [Acidisphaera sp.]|nr:pilus assembly protein [Acidisphaera sp.]
MRRLARDRRGAAAVEFAVTTLTFLILVMGMVDLGRLFSAEHALNLGVIKAARYAVVHGSSSSSPSSPSSTTAVQSAFTAAVTPVLGAADAQSCTVTVTYAGSSNAPGSQVTVQASYSWAPMTTIAHFAAITLTAQAVGTIQN